MTRETAKMTLWTSRNTERKGMITLTEVADGSDAQKHIQEAFAKKVDDARINTYSPCTEEVSLARIFG